MPAKKITAADKEATVVMAVPDFGLSTTQINALKKKFQSQFIETMGGTDAVAKMRVRVRVRVVVITGPEQQ
jgi:hypothetical protein